MRVGVVGASGYTGLELIKLLVNHPKFELSYLATSQGDAMLTGLHGALQGVLEMDIAKATPEGVANACDVVFLALPHKTAMGFAKEVLAKGVKVVDLSADYRLEKETYEAHYCVHEDSSNLPQAVYGLIEYYRDALQTSRLVASPGCYPTATLLGLLPFIPYIDVSAPIFVDAKSGVSGAGKKLSESTHFVSMNDNIVAYNPLKHRHAPEIAEKVKKIHHQEVTINFVPHLVPMTRGELVSVYATLKEEVDPLEVLEKVYGKEAFIRLREKPVDTKSVSGTHFADIFAACNGNALFVNVAIDNLLRGASSQALAAANLMCGFEEAMGLPTIATVP
jgi:N-acetyl-gamma-glutamyl-phosphate reductase